MARIEWQADWTVGVPMIDSDHRLLIDLINQVENCMDVPEEYATLGSVLAALADYTDSHFRREERLMAECGFDGLKAHALVHADLARQVRDISERYRSEHSLRATEVLAFLERWLVDHILHEDMSYRAAVAGNKPAEAAAAGVGMARQPFDWTRLRVLVLDDNDNFARLLSTVLNGVGAAAVVVASTADQAMETLAAQPFDAVLCDWQLAGTNGLEFAKAVRALPDAQKARVPLIMVTGHGDDELRQKATAAGVDAYVEKPISARSLLETLARLVA